MTDLKGTPSDAGDDDELAQLRALAGRVRPEAVAWETPPADLWDRIAAGAERIDAETLDPPTALDDRYPAPEGGTATPGDGGVAEPAPADTEPDAADVRPLDAARRARAGGARRGPARPWLLAVAAAIVLAVGAGALVVRLAGDDEPTVVAASSLERLAGDSGEGSAELLDDDGTLQLQVDTAGLDAGDGFLEVWVIDPDVTKLISLGPLRADGRYDLPPGFDAEAFPIVDVSVEPIDGNPAHSGDSRLRGTLQF
jgi:hypothetical protein